MAQRLKDNSKKDKDKDKVNVVPIEKEKEIVKNSAFDDYDDLPF